MSDTINTEQTPELEIFKSQFSAQQIESILGISNTHDVKTGGNPHKVTKAEIGLSNVENLSPTDTVTTGLTKQIITNKLGYEPATKDVATTAKAGLLTPADKLKINNAITTVDSSLNESSNNPVQNSVVAKALKDKVNASVLNDYAKKSETISEQRVQQMIDASGSDFEITENSITKKYLADDVKTSLNLADTAIQGVKLGESTYTADVDGNVKLPDYPTSETIAEWGFITGAEVKGGYVKPDAGIPKNHLTETVQTSLDKADSAAQSVKVGDVPYVASEGVVSLPSYPSLDEYVKTTELPDLSGFATTEVVNVAVSNKVDKTTDVVSVLDGTNPDKLVTGKAIYDYVNTSIATNSGNYIGNFGSLDELNAANGSNGYTFNNNDYAFIVTESDDHTPEYERYKYSTAGDTPGWKAEYTINNSTFTDEQWAAITSGITENDVATFKTAYHVPTDVEGNSTGIPKIHLSEAVQASLDKADSADAQVKTLSQYAKTETIQPSLNLANTAVQRVNVGSAEYNSVGGVVSLPDYPSLDDYAKSTDVDAKITEYNDSINDSLAKADSAYQMPKDENGLETGIPMEDLEQSIRTALNSITPEAAVFVRTETFEPVAATASTAKTTATQALEVANNAYVVPETGIPTDKLCSEAQEVIRDAACMSSISGTLDKADNSVQGIKINDTEYYKNTDGIVTLPEYPDVSSFANESDVNSALSTKLNTSDVINTVEDESPKLVSSKAIYDFVNSSVATNTAKYMGQVTNVSELNNFATADENDYAFVVTESEDQTPRYNRYKYTSASGEGKWEYEYTLNNSSFTDAQWKAITSGISADDVATFRDAYHLPDGGIPKTDLTSTVQSSLGKADTAIQKVTPSRTSITPGTLPKFSASYANETLTLTYTKGTLPNDGNSVSVVNGVTASK